MAQATVRPGLARALLLLVVVALGAAAALPRYLAEGQGCDERGVAGTCRRVRQCEAARRALQQRRPLPQRCGFAGLEEVVCCVDGGVETQPQPQPHDGDDNRLPADDGWRPRAGQRPSLAACKSYINQRSGLTYHILNGQNAEEGEFPHMAALGYSVSGTVGLSWLCGGTLISDQYVLTAAHCCTNRMMRNPLRVKIGILNQQSVTDSDSVYAVKDVIVHPNYKKPYYANDIALLRLDRRVEFTDTVFPACLYTEERDPAKFIATGWGATAASGTGKSQVLLKTTINPVPMSKCQTTYKNKFPDGLSSSVICAGDPQGKSDTCVGDSGGPLQVASENGAPSSIVGITSVGPKPCGGTIPSVYTRVSAYLDWIEKYVWP